MNPVVCFGSYFRFYGRIAKGPDCHEKDILTAIEENKGGLAGESKY